MNTKVLTKLFKLKQSGDMAVVSKFLLGVQNLRQRDADFIEPPVGIGSVHFQTKQEGGWDRQRSITRRTRGRFIDIHGRRLADRMGELP